MKTNNSLYTLNVILSIAKNLAVSDFSDVCADLKIFHFTQDDTLKSNNYRIFLGP